MDDKGVDLGRRRFLITATSFLGAVGAAFAAIPFIASWLPSAKARAAGAPVTVDISRLKPGERLVIEWRGKPVWVVRRNREELDSLATDEDQLRDPESRVDQQPLYAQNRFRSINPEYLVLVGICTHLGCSPSYRPQPGSLNPTWEGGFYCPCHGSTFDMAGRVFKGVPAPINMEVPPYRFVDDTTVVIGENPSAEELQRMSA